MNTRIATEPMTQPEPADRSSDRAVARSYEHCRLVTRRRARNFYYGMMLTPEPKRSAMYAIYAWMRAADDLADETDDAATDDRNRALDAFWQETLTAWDSDAALPDGELWPALREVVLTYDVRQEWFAAMIEGQRLDMSRTRYDTFDELADYCYRVAGTVGLNCIAVWGYAGGKATRELAVTRGLAFQMTNIVRDVVEDAQRDRVYLPAEDLAKFDLDDAAFIRMARQGEGDDRFASLIAFEAKRVLDLYEASKPLERSISPACRRTSWAMCRIYRGLMEKIARQPQRVLRERVRLHCLRKLSIAAQASLRTAGSLAP